MLPITTQIDGTNEKKNENEWEKIEKISYGMLAYRPWNTRHKSTQIRQIIDICIG